jgi:hypothetical protein
MRRRAKAVLGLWAAGVAVGLWGGERPAQAQGAGDKAAAEALFDEGKRLFVDKKFTEACSRFEASQRLDPGIGTLLYLADCYENVGRFASAWATFREASSAAKAAGQGDRERIASERARLVEPKLYRLTVKVEAPAPGLKVTRNDTEVKAETWNVALPVDAGAYTLSASAPGKKPWSMRLEIPAGAGAQSVTVPALQDDPNAPKVVEGQKPDGGTAPPPPAEAPGKGQRVAGIIVGSIGLAALAAGGALGGLAKSKFASAKTTCPNIPCSDMGGIDAAHQAGVMADAATGMFVVGGAAVAAGILTFALAPSGPGAGKSKSAWIAPSFGPGAAGLTAGMVLR